MESKKIKQISGWIIGILLIVGIILFMPVKAQAANPKLVTLQPNRTYTKYDLDSDGKADKILIDAKWNERYSYYSTVSIIINNKKVYSLSFEAYDADVLHTKLCTLSNKKAYLFMEATGVSMWEPVAKLFQYKGNKLYQVFNFRSLLNENYKGYTYRLSCEVASVKNNTINMRYFSTLFTIGGIYFNVPLKYSNGKMVLATNTFTVSPTKRLTTMRKIQTYTTVKQNKKSFSLSKGEIVNVKKIYIKSKKPYVQLTRRDGKTGWIVPIKNHGYSYYFKEAVFL